MEGLGTGEVRLSRGAAQSRPPPIVVSCRIWTIYFDHSGSEKLGEVQFNDKGKVSWEFLKTYSSAHSRDRR